MPQVGQSGVDPNLVCLYFLPLNLATMRLPPPETCLTFPFSRYPQFITLSGVHVWAGSVHHIYYHQVWPNHS